MDVKGKAMKLIKNVKLASISVNLKISSIVLCETILNIEVLYRIFLSERTFRIFTNILENKFRMNDSFFERHGPHLISSHTISVLDLIVGTEIKFTTISGKVMKVKVPVGTQPNTQIKLSGQGMPIADPRGPNVTSGQFGDQIILLKGIIPDTIEQGVIDAITKYKDIQDLKDN